MPIFKICVISLAAVILSLQFKQVKSEYTVLIMIITTIITFYFCSEKLMNIISIIKKKKKKSMIDISYIELLLKITGISFICQISSDISRDSGMSTLASQIEMFGKVGIIVSGLPVFIKLVDTLTGMI